MHGKGNMASSAGQAREAAAADAVMRSSRGGWRASRESVDANGQGRQAGAQALSPRDRRRLRQSDMRGARLWWPRLWFGQRHAVAMLKSET